MVDEWVVAQGWLLHDKTDLLRDDRLPDYERRVINAAQAIAQLHGGEIDWENTDIRLRHISFITPDEETAEAIAMDLESLLGDEIG